MAQCCYTHLTTEDRKDIVYYYNKHGLSMRAIAQRIGTSHSTVLRGLKRTRNAHGHYVPAHAQKLACQRKTHRHWSEYMEILFIRSYICDGPERGWSPEQIARRISIDYPGTSISHETIYQ